MIMPNVNEYFEILGLKPCLNITLSDIKKAYYKSAKAWHPDHHQGLVTQEIAGVKFIKIQEAYQYLTKYNAMLNSLTDLRNKLLNYIELWPEQAQNTAKENFQDINIIMAIELLIASGKFLTFEDFINPVDPFLWEMLKNSHFIDYLINPPNTQYDRRKPFSEIFNQFAINESEQGLIPYDGEYVTDLRVREKNLPIERLSLSVNQRFWLFLAADIEVHNDSPYIDCLYLYNIMWQLIKENLYQYIRSGGSSNTTTLANILEVFDCLKEHSCGRYLANVYNKFVAPLQDKTDFLREMNDAKSKTKADQIEFVLADLEIKITQQVTSFLTIKNNVRLNKNDIFDLITQIHTTFIDTVKTMQESKEINKSRNLIADILKVSLGIFLATVTLGLITLSQSFRNKFFKTKTRVLVEESQDKINNSYFQAQPPVEYKIPPMPYWGI